MLQSEHGFCQQNVAERGQAEDWQLNKKMVAVPNCLNGRCVGAVLY